MLHRFLFRLSRHDVGDETENPVNENEYRSGEINGDEYEEEIYNR
jgi:hypothetical protein